MDIIFRSRNVSNLTQSTRREVCYWSASDIGLIIPILNVNIDWIQSLFAEIFSQFLDSPLLH